MPSQMLCPRCTAWTTTPDARIDLDELIEWTCGNCGCENLTFCETYPRDEVDDPEDEDDDE